MDKMKTEWVAKGGSIFTKELTTIKVGTGGGKLLEVPESVAFNVGDDMANHLVKLHNDSLRLRQRQ